MSIAKVNVDDIGNSVDKLAFSVIVFLTAFVIFAFSQMCMAANNAQRLSSYEDINAYDLVQDVVESAPLVVDTTEIEDFLGTLDDEIREYVPRFDLEEAIRSGEGPSIDVPHLFSGAFDFLTREIKVNLKLLGQLIIIAVISSVMTTFVSKSAGDSCGAVASSICRVAAIGIGINSFRITVQIAQTAVSDMASFMQALMPTMAGTLIATGAVSTAAVVSPLILSWVTLVATIINSTVIPLFLVSFVLKMVNSMSGSNSVSKLAGLFKTAALTVLGLLSTIFLGVLSMRSGFASVSDAVAAKATKFLSGALVPVVGKFFGDAIDLIATSSLVVKSAFGIFGLCTLTVVMLFPLLKMLCVVFMFRIASAIVQPLGDEKIASCMSDVADTLSNVCVSVAVVALMFFVSVSIIIGLGSSMSAMR